MYKYSYIPDPGSIYTFLAFQIFLIKDYSLIKFF
jgi:hypothetical protein